MKQLFWIIGMAIALVAYLVLLAGYAYGQDLEIPLDTIHRGGPGELFFEGEIEVQAGAECIAVLTWTNNVPDASEHPDTDILVGPITFFDVERGTNFTATKPFTATGTVEVYTRLGAHGVTSGGGDLEVECNPPTTTTTTAEPPSSTTTTTLPPTDTTAPPTTVPPVTTTTEPPPINGIETGGGACADGGCEGFRLTPLETRLSLLAASGLAVVGGLATAKEYANWRRGDE